LPNHGDPVAFVGRNGLATVLTMIGLEVTDELFGLGLLGKYFDSRLPDWLNLRGIFTCHLSK
jgi:hypothetical protein